MRIKSLLAIGGLFLVALFATPMVNAATDDGSKRCERCHDEDDLPDWSKSAHAVKADVRTPSCIACHGPSPTHIDKPAGVSKRPKPDRVFSKHGGLPPAERSEVCLSCHDKDAKRALWASSAHPSADVACTTCHKVHTSHDRALSKTTEAAFCFSCHKEQRVQAMKPSRHPIVEGKMSCSSCHNVHGSFGDKLVKRDSTNDTCFSCHAEKRGPFVHQHEPVSDNCANCHNPHGSTIAGMLTARPPMLCQQCHTPHVAGEVGALGGQPGVYSRANPDQGPQIGAGTSGKNVVTMWQGRSCLACHTQVHGSNNPSATNPTPQLMFR